MRCTRPTEAAPAPERTTRQRQTQTCSVPAHPVAAAEAPQSARDPQVPERREQEGAEVEGGVKGTRCTRPQKRGEAGVCSSGNSAQRRLSPPPCPTVLVPWRSWGSAGDGQPHHPRYYARTVTAHQHR